MNTRIRAIRTVLLLTTLVGLNGLFKSWSAASAARSPSQQSQPLSSPRKSINLSASPADSYSPALAASEEAVHVLWEESGRIYHRFRDGQDWSPVRRVATGEQPALAVDAQGLAHAVFVNEFGGNYEIYYCRWNGTAWSLPRNLSNTSGVSSAPNLALQEDGLVHAVWADNTPGYNVIYHAYWDGTYWINEPIPNAFGGAPAVAASSGALHVVWQDRDAAEMPYEVYYCRWNGTEWSLPENLSDTAGEQSIIPSIAVDRSGYAHTVWQERSGGGYKVEYAWGTVGYWSIPELVAPGDEESYLPCVTLGRRGALFVGWDVGNAAFYRHRMSAGGAWSPLLGVVDDPTGVSDLQLAVDGAGTLLALWVQRAAGDNWDVFFQELTYRVVLPLIVRGT